MNNNYFTASEFFLDFSVLILNNIVLLLLSTLFFSLNLNYLNIFIVIILIEQQNNFYIEKKSIAFFIIKIY